MKGWETLELQGPDCLDYLQRMTSANFKTLQPGSFTPATLLSATGKIQLYFKALMLERDHFLLLVPPSQNAFEDLEKMHFREDFKIFPLGSRWTYVRVLSQQPLAIDAGKFEAKDGSFTLNESKWNTPPFKYDFGYLVEAEELDSLRASLGGAGFEEKQDLEAFRLRARDPAVPSELNSQVIPLEAELDDAVHENKGCYPGQEVIERIRAMGQVPRTLAVFRGTGELPEAGQDILSLDATVGKLTSAALDPLDGGWIGLGFVRRSMAKPEMTFSIAGQPVRMVS